MPGVRYNFVANDGADWDVGITWREKGVESNPVDLTGYTARLQIRKRDVDGSLVAELANDDGITIDGAAGTIIISVPGSVTADWDFDVADYELQLESSGGKIYSLMYGALELKSSLFS